MNTGRKKSILAALIAEGSASLNFVKFTLAWTIRRFPRGSLILSEAWDSNKVLMRSRRASLMGNRLGAIFNCCNRGRGESTQKNKINR